MTGSPTPIPGPSFLVYRVRRGDSLIGIAARYATTPQSLAYWNRDTYPSLDPDSAAYRPDHLEVGWRLRLIPGVILDEIEPTPTIRPRPTPRASQPPPPTPRADGVSLLVSHGTRGSELVALTFDLGVEAGQPAEVLQWLIDHGVRSTLFPTGESVSGEEPGSRLLATIASHPDLFWVGNRSWNSPDFTTLAPAAMKTQLEQTEELIAGATGRSTRPFFRPPGGFHDAAVREAVGAAGWTFTVLWDINPLDDRPPEAGGPTASDIASLILSRAQGGSIILLHLTGRNTLAALLEIVAGLESRGLAMVTLGEMFGY